MVLNKCLPLLFPSPVFPLFLLLISSPWLVSFSSPSLPLLLVPSLPSTHPTNLPSSWPFFSKLLLVPPAIFLSIPSATQTLSCFLFPCCPSSSLFLLSPSLVPTCGRSMTHPWRMWRPLRACLTFVIHSSSTGARHRRRLKTHPSLGSLR